MAESFIESILELEHRQAILVEAEDIQMLTCTFESTLDLNKQPPLMHSREVVRVLLEIPAAPHSGGVLLCTRKGRFDQEQPFLHTLTEWASFDAWQRCMFICVKNYVHTEVMTQKKLQTMFELYKQEGLF
ncbi:hypothetical protein [Laceyella putida]|uniref:Uncharacterized protein n=1 Tax=Laceyella putida TaxID=110101 RepID=A0ABW2RM50_9BACL